nr:hornerin-like [Physcomitrium patens]|eukprot:XP_024386097.1 hornerin-like [Physcomitrella patens]
MAAVAESGGGGGGGGAGAVGGPSSTPSSLSMVSLKPGKRTKPSGSKQRNHKLPKVTTPSLVSEQEVEVAEALFDLARMFTQPAAAVVESKPEPRVIHSDLKSEAKLERKISSGSGSSLPPHPSNGPAVSSSVSAAGPAAGAAVAGTVRSSSPVSASAASPMSSPPTGASFAEVTKRKRPRLRTRTDDGGSRPKTGAMTASIALSAVQVKDANQSSSQGPTAERGTVKLEGNVSVTPIVCAISNNVAETASSAPNVAVASSGVAATVTASRGGVADVSTPRTDNNGMEKKVTLLEKTITQCNGEVEAPSSNLLEKGVEGSSVREKKIGMSECSGFGTGPNTSVDVALSASVIAEETITKTELGKRTPELAADIGRQPKREIDLMVAPSNLEDASSSEKYCEGEVGDVREATEKPAVFGQVDLAIAVNVDSSRAETRQHTEESDLAEKEKAKQLKKDEAKDREQELERSRAENDRRREANIQRESARELSKQRAREMEREFTEAIKVATQKSSNTIKGENERVQKAEKAGLGPSATTSTVSVPAPPIAISSAATGRAHSAVSSKSVGVLGCTAEITKSIPGSLGYFPTPAPAAVPEVPYIVPQRAAWKRCALHVYIAHFIDLQQQLKQHQSFFGGPNQGYSKSYNLNVAVGGSDAVLGGAVGSPMVGGVGAGGADVDATERGLNAAAMAAAAAASMQGAKERAHGVGVAGRKSPGGEQHGGQQAAGLSVQVGVGGLRWEGVMEWVGEVEGVEVGCVGTGSVGSNGGVASAAVQAQYMQAMMQQPSGYPFGQFPGHYGAVSHTGVQQAAAQFFAAGGPYFTHHMVAHGQQAGGGGGGGGVGKQQGQGGRGYGGGGSGAQGLGSQAGSHSHSHSHSHAVQQGQQGGTRAGEREGSTAGENGSSGESRMSMVRGGGGYGQGVGSAGSGLGSGSMGGGGGVDCKLMVGTGKGSKGREQQRQGQGQGQGQGGGGKGGDGVSSGGHGMSMGGAMNRGASVGPGPLGLAPVAAVMAPQGHAMIQSMAESGRGHQQLSGSISLEQQQQQHHHLMQIHHSQQQYGVNQQPQMQQRSAQNPRNAVVYVEDGLGGKDGTYTSSIGRVSEREVLEDRKLHNKRSSGASSPLSRESDSSSGMQSLSAGGGGIASSRLAGSPYHPMGSVYANMASRPSGQSASMSGTAPVQSQVLAGPKSGVARLKSTGASASASPVTLHMTSQASFAECNPGSSGAVTSTAVQNAFGCQVGKPSEAGQHTQMKLNQRSTPAALPGTTPLPAVSGTDFQAVLAAAMVKSSQGQSTQRATQLGGNINAGSNSRRRTARAGSPVSSAGVPLSPMAPPSKSSGLNSAKSSSSQKSSFPASQKVVVGAASGGGKRASSISSGYPVPSILSSSLMAQSTSGKNSQQPQMHVKGQGQGQGPQQHVGYQSQGSAQGPSQLQQQFHQQQVQQQQQHMMLLQKHPMLHQHIFHHQHLHQQQQPSHIQGSQGVAHQLQESPQATPHQQQPGSGPQTYKPSSQHLQQAQQMQPPQQQFAGGGGNGSLALSPGVSVGAGSNSSEGGGGRSSTNADAGGGGPNGRSCESAKQGGGGSVGMVNAGGQRNGGYVQQYGGGGGVSSGEQQSGSGGSGGPSGYNEGKSKSGAAGRDGGQKAVNEMRVAQGAMAGRGASTMGGSPGAQGSSQRGQGGGGSGSKGGMGQASNLGDVGQSRTSGMMSSSMSGGGGSGGSMSNGQSKNSSSGNVESGGDGRGGTNEGSLQQGGGSGSHGAGGGGVVGSSPIAGMGGQAPTSVVQQ